MKVETISRPDYRITLDNDEEILLENLLSYYLNATGMVQVNGDAKPRTRDFASKLYEQIKEAK